MKKVILIKFGGSVITDKTTPKKADLKVIGRLSDELSTARKKSGYLFILGHGSGSFGHQPASEYKTIDGLKSKKDLPGMAKVKYDASLLNILVFDFLIKAGLPAFPLPPSAFITSKNKKLDQISVLPIINLLNFNAVPLVYGDVITDSEIGCTIYSTEKVLNEIAVKLPESGYKPEMVIEVGNTEGVLNNKGETIKEINATNIKNVLAMLSETSAVDVTGGMIHKVNEAYSLAKTGIPTLIISGEKGNLEKAILGKKINGTSVKI